MIGEVKRKKRMRTAESSNVQERRDVEIFVARVYIHVFKIGGEQIVGEARKFDYEKCFA